MLYGSFCGPAIVLIHLDLGLQGICVGFHYLVQMGYLSKKKKTYNWVIFLQTHFLFVNSLGFIGKGSIRKRQKKKNVWGVTSTTHEAWTHHMVSAKPTPWSEEITWVEKYGFWAHYVPWAQLWGILGNKPNSVFFFFF